MGSSQRSFRHAVLPAVAVIAVAGGAAGAAAPAAGAGRAPARHGMTRATAAAFFRHGGLPWLGGPGRRGVPGIVKPGIASQLDGVFCTAASNCWAVGNYRTGKAELNQVLRWNGTTWTQVSVPNPGGTGTGDLSELFAVRCTSASDCWAVGDYQKFSQAGLDQALHWNGKSWSKVDTPTPGGTLGNDFSTLFDVVCTSAANCWAGGNDGFSTSKEEVVVNQMLRWNGTKWSLATVPNPGGSAANSGNLISAIRCTSATNCLAVGFYGTVAPFESANMALRWNGTNWSKLTTPSPGGTTTAGHFNELAGLGCATASNCWAAGSYGTATAASVTALNQILHWNGTAWAQQATPDPDGTGEGASNELFAANCTSVTSCWAVGAYGSFSGGTGVILNQALRWTQNKWILATTPDPGGTSDGDSNGLLSVRCTSQANCWAVGSRQKLNAAQVNEALRWNGSTWSTG